MIGTIKAIHVTCVVITGVLFVYRGTMLLLLDKPLQRAWRVLPHVNDTVLLVSAIALAIQTQQYPFIHGWLGAKVIALLVYIGLGMLAFKPVLSKNHRKLIWGCAMLVYIYIVMVAFTRSVIPL